MYRKNNLTETQIMSLTRSWKLNLQIPHHKKTEEIWSMTQEKPRRENLLKRVLLFIFLSKKKITIYRRKQT